MAKVKQPLFSLDARRKLGNDIVFKRQGRTAIVETRPIPPDARSVGQLSWRHMFLKVVALWHALSAAEKEAWESLGRKRHMTGYAWFVSQALRPNPGIYLPLQGGIMSGDIDMAKNRLLKLPIPDDDQEAASKKYHDDNKYTDAEVDAILAVHTAIAGAHHARYTDAEVDAILAVHAALVTGVHGAGDSILATTFDIVTHGIGAKHRWTLNKLRLGAGAGANPTEVDLPTAVYPKLHTMTMFQSFPAYGTFFSNPEHVNDGNVASEAKANAIGQYAQVDFWSPTRITQFRQYGRNFPQNEDGRWKIEYIATDDAWHDWVTGIPTRTTQSWGNWDSSGGEVVAQAIRLTCTTVDTAVNQSGLFELEIKY